MFLHSARLIANPGSGSGRAERLASRIARELARRGFDVEVTLTAGPGHATELASEAMAQGAAVVFALGGDGTVREAAAGLLGGETALAVLPAGTTNILARSVGIPLAPLAAARAYDGQGPLDVDRMDVGQCAGQPFLAVASVGIDAQTMAACSPAAKRRWGRAAVLAEGLRQLRRGRLVRYRVEADGGAAEDATFVAVCNIPHYGGPFHMAPGADWRDGTLDLVVFSGTHLRSTLGFIAAFWMRRHLRRADVSYRPTRRVVIDGDPEGALQLDGDAVASELPATVEVVPHGLPVLQVASRRQRAAGGRPGPAAPTL